MEPIPVKTAQPPARREDYTARALLAGALTRGAEAFTAIVSRAMAADALPQRVLLASSAAQPESQPVLDALDRVVDSIMNGSDLSPEFPKIARLIHAQDQRAEVISQLVLTQDYKRLAKATRAREKLEETIFTLAQNDELLPAERLLVLERLDNLIRDTRKGISLQSTSIADIRAMLEKIDYATEAAGETLKRKFEKTSPQGREVVRKLITNLDKRLRSATDASDA
jgi:hypothetical protein